MVENGHYAETTERPLLAKDALAPNETKMNGHVVVQPVEVPIEDPVAQPEIPTIPQLRKFTGTYTVTDRPLGYIKPVRIITIGAGASGINMAYQVKNYLREAELVVYDKNPALGGTWFENRYPGCKCDIPSHNYQFAWEPNPDWAAMFSPAEEIREYLEKCVAKHDLSGYFKLAHEVIEARWQEESGRWIVKIRKTETGEVFEDECNYLLNAGGILNAWRWPNIPGLHNFRGKLVHSANWPESFDYKDLKVAVIGNGSTGIQIVPALQPHVKELVHLIRSPTWVTPGAASRYPSLRGGNMPEHFSEEQKELFRQNPEKYLAFRKAVEVEINAKFRMLVNGAQEAAKARLDAANSMIGLLKDSPELIEKLIPDFPVGCRRITPGVGYLESFAKPNVRVITDARIDHVDDKGLVMSTGEHIEVDAIVCATGFDVSFSPRFPVTGRDGVSLKDVWGEPNVPQAYLSMAIPKFPNYFEVKSTVFLGPNAPISHGSVFTITEQCSKYILQLITKAQVELIKAIDVKQEAVDDLAIHIHHFMPRTAWAGNCRSWFKNGRSSGPIIAIHPGSRLHWFHALERPKFEDFDYTYDTGNRFQFLGNGFSTREEEGADQTWYLDQVAPKLLYY
ncbi:putative sterigmatocystin biosynthesis monooxygenase stcW [Fonsecaea pedrosoi]|nr:putative sterigmatocystin biosynthesis monooxygenase stcW [Fonsecaea pedrosoi]